MSVQSSSRRRCFRLLLVAAYAAMVVMGSAVEQAAGAEAATPSQDQLLAERDRLVEEVLQLRDAGQWAEAIAVAERIAAIEADAFGEMHMEVAGTLRHIALWRLRLQHYQQAADAYGRRLAILQANEGVPAWDVADARVGQEDAARLAALGPEERAALARAEALRDRTIDLFQAGDDAGAVAALREARDQFARLLGADHLETAGVWMELATLHGELGQAEEVRDALATALGIHRRRLGDVHADVATLLSYLGNVLQQMGEADEARKTLLEGLAVCRQVFGNAHRTTAETLNNLSALARRTGDLQSALAYATEALQTLRAAEGDAHVDVAIAWSNLGQVQLDLGDLDASRSSYQQSLTVAEAALGAGHAQTLPLLETLADVAAAQGDAAEAVAFRRQALTVCQASWGERDARTVAAWDAVAAALVGADDLTGAVKCHEEIVAARREAFGPNAPETAAALGNLAMTLMQAGDQAAARARFEDSIAAYRALADAEPNANLINVLNNLGMLLQSDGDWDGAERCFIEALALARKLLGDEHLLTAIVLGNSGSLDAAADRHAQALAKFREAYAILRDKLPAGDPDVISMLTNIIEAAQSLYDFETVLATQREALDALVAARGAEDPEAIVHRNNLGRTYQQMGRFDEAASCLREALRLQRESRPDDAESTARLLSNLGAVLVESGDYAGARAAHEESLAICRASLDPDHPQTARTLNNLGWLKQVVAEFAAAKAHYEEALAIERRAFGEDNDHAAATLGNLGLLAREVGNIEEARGYYAQSLQILQRVFGPRTPEAAVALYNLGDLEMTGGYFAAARPYIEEALAIRRETFGEMHPETARSISQVGSLYHDLGRLDRARECYEQALAIRRAVLGPQHDLTAGSLNDLGALLGQMGDRAAAVQYYEQALAIRRSALGDRHPQVAVQLLNVAYCRKRAGDFAAAERLYREALDIQTSVYGRRHRSTATALLSLGWLHSDQGDLAAARVAFEQAEDIYRETLGETHPRRAEALSSLGDVALSSGNPTAAQEYFEQTLAIRRAVYGESHPEVATALDNLGIALAAQGDYPGAAEQLLAAAAIQRQFHEQLLFGMSDRDMGLLLQRAAAEVDILASMPLTAATREAAAAELLSRKAVEFEVLNQRGAVERLARGDPQLAALRDELRQVQRRLEHLATTPAAAANSDELAAQRQSLQQRCEELEKQLSRRLAAALGADRSLAVKLDDVRAQLGDAALVELVRYRRWQFGVPGRGPAAGPAHYAAFVVTSADQTPALIELGPAAEIDALTDELAQLTRDFARVAGGFADEQLLEEDYRAAARRLYDKAFAPLVESLGDAQRVYLGLDGRLHDVPFEALVGPDEKYLIETGYEFAYVNSGRDLLRHRQSTESAGDGVYVFAGPNYNLPVAERGTLVASLNAPGSATDSVVETAPPTETIALADVAPGAPSMSRAADTRGGWRLLPGADLEGEEAAAAFAGSSFGPVTIRTGDEALETLVKRVRRPRALVLVTHGDFLENQPGGHDASAGGTRGFEVDSLARGGASQARLGLGALEDPLLRSYLVFAGANKLGDLPDDSPLDNGWLTAQEISQMDLAGADLVVLSACNTNRGESENGQAIVGMRSAFLFAGARSIVGSLYAVPNVETRQLMRPFYEAVAAGEGRLAALNAAKRQFIRDRRNTDGAAHPFYWASFILVGEP